MLRRPPSTTRTYTLFPTRRSSDLVAPVMGNGKAISSSRIREALQTGDCAEATRLLTRPFAIEGVVQHGDKVGSEIGYPTANIDTSTYLRPAYGIYAVRGRFPDGQTGSAACRAKGGQYV